MSVHPLPEKVLQFGTGILLRGLPDYFIDLANRQGIFNGSILVVKSTEGDIQDFQKNNGRYTICVRGLQRGKAISEDIVNNSISRVVTANEQWSEVLLAASSRELGVIISNTTEVGIKFEAESIFKIPPTSFPAKLTAVLYERFKKMGARSNDLVVVPTELVPDNGKTLREIVLQLAEHNRLDPTFPDWLAQKVMFCNSLVDRIVTRPSERVKSSVPHHDSLTIQAEPYKLWAIEGDERVKKALPFSAADSAVVIARDIEHYRERKLRIVNGGGTITASIGFLRGINTFYQCMMQPEMASLVENVVIKEIEPTLPDNTRDDTRQFALEVLERWRNEYTEHHLLSINLQASAKTKLRNVPTYFRYFSRFQSLPPLMVEGFAAHLLFMKGVEQEGKKYFGSRGGELYTIQDDQAPYFFNAWKEVDTANSESLRAFVSRVCRNEPLWGADLTTLPGFVDAVLDKLTLLLRHG